MKILFITRSTVYSGPGGDTIQLENTKLFLEKLGCEVDVATTPYPVLNGYDVVHFFNLRNPQDILLNVRRVRDAGIPSVLSTIWGSYYECDQKERKGFQKLIANTFKESQVEYFKTAARIILNANFNRNTFPYLLKGHLGSQKEIVRKVDFLLPNSPTELIRVREDMGVYSKPGCYVANAVDLTVFNDDILVSDKYKKLKGCLLSAARVEIRKSQLDLIRAVKGLPYKLVIVGKPSPNSLSYFNQCKDEADDNVSFIEHVTQSELAELYKICKAHALISWMETPGLSSLEAAVMNSNLLITDRGDTEFYFEGLATYCEPGDVQSIREGIITVMEKEVDPALSKRVIENFTWEHTAKQTLSGYKEALRINQRKVSTKFN